MTYKIGGEVKSQNKVYLINNPEDPAERAKGCTCKRYFHTGLPCIHIAWLVNNLRKDINNYIPRVFTVGAAKAIYTAKVSSFSDDLLKWIKLSPEFDGPLLPGKFMWKAETKKDDKEKSESKGEKDEEDVKKDKRLHSAPSDKEESSREENSKESNDEISGDEECAVSGYVEVSFKESEEKEEEEKTKQNEVQTTGERDGCVDILEESTQSSTSIINSGSGGPTDVVTAATLMVQANR